jgi:predicted nucleotidyltransferase component of viral defense system
MTPEIKEQLKDIKNNSIFGENDFYFIGGSALSFYLDHRLSYDIDIVATKKLPIEKIKSFAFGIGARAIQDRKAAQFKINSGEDIQNYHMKFMLNGVKLEFSYFRSEICNEILKNASLNLYENNEDDKSLLKILSLEDIIKLKIIALFNRQKTRDLFDVAVILQKNFCGLKELEQIYSFVKTGNKSIKDYIDKFNSINDDGDNSLDFLKHQEYYKIFRSLNQKNRFLKAKSMFIEEYEKIQKEKIKAIERNLRRSKVKK